MDRVTCTLESRTGRFDVPYSTGYQTYGGLLSLISESDASLAEDLHDAPFASFTNSGLLGSFDWDVDREYHKGVKPNASYELRLGITHPDDEAVFNAISKALIIDNEPLTLAHGSFRVASVETRSETHETLLEQAAADVADGATGVSITFETTTACQRYDDVWEAQPERTHLFTSLADRWNATAPEADELALDAETVGSELFTRPELGTHNTRSIVVHRREPGSNTDDATEPVSADGGNHVNEVQGFLGEWHYQFKHASEATKTAIIALARFAEFAGIGHHTARGAGTVSVEVTGV